MERVSGKEEEIDPMSVENKSLENSHGMNFVVDDSEWICS